MTWRSDYASSDDCGGGTGRHSSWDEPSVSPSRSTFQVHRPLRWHRRDPSGTRARWRDMRLLRRDRPTRAANIRSELRSDRRRGRSLSRSRHPAGIRCPCGGLSVSTVQHRWREQESEPRPRTRLCRSGKRQSLLRDCSHREQDASKRPVPGERQEPALPRWRSDVRDHPSEAATDRLRAMGWRRRCKGLGATASRAHVHHRSPRRHLRFRFPRGPWPAARRETKARGHPRARCPFTVPTF